MDNLSDLYGTVDRLNSDELDQLSAYIEQKRMQTKIADETPHERAAALMAAFAEMREGLTEEELDEIVKAMNYEYIEPIDPAEWAWLDGAEDENG